MSNIHSLLSSLEDPFQLFPLESVARQVASLVDDSEERMALRNGWWGVSVKFRSVEDEHDVEVIRLLIGSTFVLAQAAITQTIAITKKIRDIVGRPIWLPNDKVEIMSTEATVNAATGHSEIVLFDAVANYFKHHHEWPSNWQTPSSPMQQRTIRLVLDLGFIPESEINLYIALRNLGVGTSDMSYLGRSIQTWREGLARHLDKLIADHSPEIPESVC